ncbi:MAG: substrate-binding domain-containing protein, partial [Pseudomonadales bacterium]|nr:substrate-binding domain-containing protein [Pseudomonadales bacterium]
MSSSKKVKVITPDTYHQFPWIVPALSLCSTEVAAWNRKYQLDEYAVLSVDDVEIGLVAVEKGIGVIVLPTFIGDRSCKIKRMSDDITGLKTDLWVLSHEDQRNTTRIALLRNALSECLKNNLK